MVILYRTTKFKSANILVIAIWGSTAKFNSRQYFQLYGMRIMRMHVWLISYIKLDHTLYWTNYGSIEQGTLRVILSLQVFQSSCRVGASKEEGIQGICKQHVCTVDLQYLVIYMCTSAKVQNSRIA